MYLEPRQNLRWNIFSNIFLLVNYFRWKTTSRSSHQRCSIRKGVLKNFAKFNRKYLRQCFSFNKVAGLKTTTLLIKWLWHRCFPVNFAKLLRTSFLQNTSGGCFFISRMSEKVPYKPLHIVCQGSATYSSNYCSMQIEQINKY